MYFISDFYINSIKSTSNSNKQNDKEDEKDINENLKSPKDKQPIKPFLFINLNETKKLTKDDIGSPTN